MKLRVLSSFEPGPGTLICEEDPTVESPVVSGIAFNRDEAQIAVTQVPHEAGVAYGCLKAVADAAIEVDMIVVSAPREGRVDLSFTVHRDDYSKALRLAQQAIGGHAGTGITGDDRVAKVAVVGSGMRSHAGIASKLFETLGAEGINVLLVSTSEIKISVLVAEHEVERAVRALHKVFWSDRVPSR
jgi:aspartate kinase